MGIITEIKKLAVGEGVTLKHLAQCISAKRGKHFSQSNFSNKLKNNTLNSKEIDTILEELGYKIEFTRT